VQDFLRQYSPRWNQVGRVCFHLAENKNNEKKPFAFLATYTTLASHGTLPQHLPLKRALQESSAENASSALLAASYPPFEDVFSPPQPPSPQRRDPLSFSRQGKMDFIRGDFKIQEEQTIQNLEKKTTASAVLSSGFVGLWLCLICHFWYSYYQQVKRNTCVDLPNMRCV
jgi:hypothetical protein